MFDVDSCLDGKKNIKRKLGKMIKSKTTTTQIDDVQRFNVNSYSNWLTIQKCEKEKKKYNKLYWNIFFICNFYLMRSVCSVKATANNSWLYIYV